MKKILAFLFFVSLSAKIFSQSNDSLYIRKYTTIVVSTAFHQNIGSETPSQGEQFTSFSLTAIRGCQVKFNYFGIGAGIDKWTNAVLFPVFAEYKLNLSYNKVVPYGFVDIGYAFGHKDKLPYYERKENGEWLVKLGLGVKINLNKKYALNIDYFKKIQVTETLYSEYEGHAIGLGPVEKYSVIYGFDGLGLGLDF